MQVRKRANPPTRADVSGPLNEASISALEGSPPNPRTDSRSHPCSSWKGRHNSSAANKKIGNSKAARVGDKKRGNLELPTNRRGG
jgi:hypothetical protein